MDRDRAFLRRRLRPDFEVGSGELRVVDLFSGCGGMTLGLAEAARSCGLSLQIPLAIDFDEVPARVFSYNFPKADVRVARVDQLFDGAIGAAGTRSEGNLASGLGEVDVLVGGPPCQGHSDLNNHTRRDDPKNALYARMARAAEILRPLVVVVENVPAVVNDRRGIVRVTADALESCGYMVTEAVIDLSLIGVPQTRKRHVLVAARSGLDPARLMPSRERWPARAIRWAIEDLSNCEPIGLDVPSVLSAENERRASWMRANDAFDLPNRLRPECHRGNHSYVSMYGRLDWDEPAQTITSGYGSMGQGRYLHPDGFRTLTPHEAARLQFFPDWFDFSAGGLETRRGRWAQMIGNAVPPKLMMEIGKLAIPEILRVRSRSDEPRPSTAASI